MIFLFYHKEVFFQYFFKLHKKLYIPIVHIRSGLDAKSRRNVTVVGRGEIDANAAADDAAVVGGAVGRR